MKKLRVILLVVLSILGIIGCGKKSEDVTSGTKIVKLGINGDENVIWENVRDELNMVGSFVKQFLLKPKQFFCTQK